MAAQVDAESFGNCTSMGESTGACPKQLPLEVIAITTPAYLRGSWKRRLDLEATIPSARS